MGYTITVPLVKEAPSEKLSAIFEKYFPTFYSSNNHKEHGYAIEHENAVYFSYSILKIEDHYLLNYLIDQISSKYGLKKTIFDKNFFYYFYDDEITYIIDKEDKEFFTENYLKNYENDSNPWSFAVRFNNSSELSFNTIQKTFYLISDIHFFKKYDLKLAEIKKLMETI
jgi:hypothetical protein